MTAISRHLSAKREISLLLVNGLKPPVPSLKGLCAGGMLPQNAMVEVFPLAQQTLRLTWFELPTRVKLITKNRPNYVVLC